MKLSYKQFSSIIIVLLFALYSLYANPEDIKITDIIKPSPTPIASSSAVMGVQDNQLYRVKDVIDGDTIELEGGQKIRLLGIDTPETRDPRTGVQCFGKEASEKVKEILLNKQVYVESDPSQSNVDRYGRLLRYIFLPDGMNVNLFMVTEGYAYEYTYDTPYKYQASFKQAQLDAQNNKKGLWAENTCNGRK